ncbi:MAG: glycosyltransferase [Chloroflexota bacterium]|nr:glycosyltransferase [Chloroflexota bacterium]
MSASADTPYALPATTIPLPALSVDAAGRLQMLSTGELRAIDLGAAARPAADGERWAVWGAARSGARMRLTHGQRWTLGGLGVMVALGLLVATHATLVALLALVTLLYLGASVYKVWMLARGERATAAGLGATLDHAALADDDLPLYTVLVPLRHERAMLPILLDRLRALDYPATKLEVLLLIEADDEETRAALAECDLPAHIRPVATPPGQPRTKPRALNVGLARARGEFLVVYDAEDQPEPMQLRKAVAAFRAASWRVVCYQARLAFYNPRQSLLTRLFTLDYYIWYDLMLQGLARAGAFVPLGGTSNHFRAATLRRLGGWDPYNVTEDSDLGARIARAGLETRMLDSETGEEAVAQVIPWLRQRSRWVKGYLQTYLTHMRDPLALWRELGPSGFVDFQTLVGGSSVILLVNPLAWLLTLAYILGHGAALDAAIRSLFPPEIYYLSLLCFVGGNFVFFYLNIYACVRGGYPDLARAMPLTPLYWLLMSVAAWMALVSLVRDPFYWAKTSHGGSLAGATSGAARASRTRIEPRYALSVIVPAYNEAQRLPASLAQLHAYLEGSGRATEVIVVDDGSADATQAVVREWMARWPALRLIERPHRGKGATVRAGVLAAAGAYVMLADADLSMSAEQIERFSPEALGPYDIAIGVREGERAQRLGEPLTRRVMGRAFNLITQTLLLPGFRDTQCGFKCLRLEVARDLALSQTRDGWGFDVEQLFLARKWGYLVREAPIVWEYKRGSRLHPARAALSMLGDVLTVRWNDLRGVYASHPAAAAVGATTNGAAEASRAG